MEELLRSGLMESWQSELHQLLQNMATSERPGREAGHHKKLHFQLQNCVDISHETNRVSFMALPGNVILNIPIVASIMAEAPFAGERTSFDIEVLTLSPDAAQSTVVIGCAQKGFKSGCEPGWSDKSVGYRPSDGSVFKDGVEILAPTSGATCVAGDKLGCGIEQKDDKGTVLVYFTKNNTRVCEVPIEGTASWFPTVSLMGLKEEVRLLQESPWRSIKAAAEPHGGIKMCAETGHVSFRSNKPNGGRKDALMMASQPFSRHFSFFEIEIIALGEKDEVSIGAVPEDYPKRLPGFRARSVGFHGRVGGIYGGRESKCDGAPKCVVGDKMGCGVEHRASGKRIVFFTHNSKSFMEAELNENCPSRLFPAIGLRAEGTGTVSACIMDPSYWLSPDSETPSKMAQANMDSVIDEELGEVMVDRETARASYTSVADVAKDAILVAAVPFSAEKCYFELELLYGNVITIGLVPAAADAQQIVRKHPGFTADSIGYNAESGQVYIDGKPLKDVGKSTYGERVGFGARIDEDGKRIVYLKKNGNIIYETPFGCCSDPVEKLCAAVGMRSSLGQVLAVRLLDRAMWGCETIDDESRDDGSIPASIQQMIDRELIECPICRDVFTDPRILPCSIHTFCAECIRSYASQHAGRHTMPCPVCRSPFTMPHGGVSNLPVNSMVTKLLELRNRLKNAASAAAGSVTGAAATGHGGANNN